ncbi:hypothetical protein E2562_029780 [Oryza meyeriana var. granulata]|uniref:Uncharacterized protein n=1 Tax=Oryza meyeriana var. granulata TaxID=110450 RepID=A0A6G1E559_9ORYZ|nr:hypothetical protein E2562_029780 [Oryza meyeriana var. granulata]
MAVGHQSISPTIPTGDFRQLENMKHRSEPDMGDDLENNTKYRLEAIKRDEEEAPFYTTDGFVQALVFAGSDWEG